MRPVIERDVVPNSCVSVVANDSEHPAEGEYVFYIEQTEMRPKRTFVLSNSRCQSVFL